MALAEHLYDYISNNLVNYPGNYFEIGVFNGDGFARIASKYVDKHCYAIDPFIEDGYTSATSSIERGNSLNTQKESFLNLTKDLKNTTHYETTSVEFCSNLTESQIDVLNVSVILIDGSHHYSDVVNDYQLSVKLLQKQKHGIVIFDDLHVSDVNKAYVEFTNLYAKNIKNSGLIGGNSNFVEIEL
jgi:hypothetical protein